MADPQEPEAVGPTAPPDAEALARLQERLERASETAERLIAEAAARAAAEAAAAAVRAGRAGAAGGADTAGQSGAAGPDGQAGPDEQAGSDKPPPAGWQRAGDGAPPPHTGEIELLLEAIQALRDRIPPELQQRLSEALREVLLALRALIDWYLERTERHRTEPVQAHDIPIV